MKTRWIAQLKVIEHQGRTYRFTEQSSNAVTQLEWAYNILKQPDTVYPNGRHSHEAANAIVEQYEDVLIDYLLI